MLNKSGERRHPCLVSCKSIQSFPIMMLALDFCICIFDALYQVEEVPPLFLAYREILSCIGIVFLNAFSVSIGMII